MHRCNKNLTTIFKFILFLALVALNVQADDEDQVSLLKITDERACLTICLS